MPDKTKPFVLETDASKVASGVVLRQYDNNRDLKPCGFISKAFSPTEQRYQIYDRELLAIVRALQTWRHYLLGSPHPITLWCDHKNLTYYREPRRLTPRQSGWHLLLSQYDLVIQHQAGTKMVQSDALSRRPDYEGEEDEGEIAVVLPDTMFIQKIQFPLRDRILSAMEENNFGRQAILSIIQTGLPPLKSAITDWIVEEGLLFYKK